MGLPMANSAGRRRLRHWFRILVAVGLGIGTMLAAPRHPASAQPLPAPAGLAGPPAGYIHMSTIANIGGDSTYLDHLALNGDPHAGFLAINNLDPYNAPTGGNHHPLGIWYNNINQRWAIYNDDGASMDQPRAWNVYVPNLDGTLLVHTSALTDTIAERTFINDPRLNGHPEAILFAQHAFNLGGGAGTLYTHTLSVAYDDVRHQWAIANADGTPMPLNRHFLVLDPGPEVVAYQHLTSSDNLHLGNRTTLNHPLLNRNPDALIFVTQNFGTGVTDKADNHNLGVWYDVPCQCWSFFHEDGALMDTGLLYNVLIIRPRTGFFVHTATNNNTSFSATQLDNPDLNGNPNAILYVTHNWSPPGAPNNVFNDHPIGVKFQTNHWYIYNRDVANMPAGAAFNVYYTGPQGNSFTVSASNTNTTSVRSLRVNSPLLNSQPLTTAVATFNYDPGSHIGATYAQPVGWRYDNAHDFWEIFNNSGSPFPARLSFNVLAAP